MCSEPAAASAGAAAIAAELVRFEPNVAAAHRDQHEHLQRLSDVRSTGALGVQVAAALGELPELLGDVAGEHRAVCSEPAGAPPPPPRSPPELVSRCGSSSSARTASTARSEPTTELMVAKRELNQEHAGGLSRGVIAGALVLHELGRGDGGDRTVAGALRFRFHTFPPLRQEEHARTREVQAEGRRVRFRRCQVDAAVAGARTRR